MLLKTQQDWRIKMKAVITELAGLEELNWAADEKVAENIFPYVLIEAINLLLNAEPKEEKFIRDYTATGDMTEKLINLLKEDGLLELLEKHASK